MKNKLSVMKKLYMFQLLNATVILKITTGVILEIIMFAIKLRTLFHLIESQN